MTDSFNMLFGTSSLCTKPDTAASYMTISTGYVLSVLDLV